MHVLILPSWYPSNSNDVNGIFFREQAIALARQGCHVGVLAVHLKSIKQWRDWLISFNPPQYTNDQSVHTLRLHSTNWFPRLPKLSAKLHCHLLEKLFQIYTKHYGNPDIIHVHAMLPVGLFALQLNRRYGIPYVITEHSSTFARGLLAREQVRQACKIAAAASQRWAVSTPFAQLLEKQLSSDINTIQWKALPNIIDQQFLNTPITEKNSQSFVFLNICLHTPNKKVDLLLCAFAQKFKGQNNIKLRLGGDGPNHHKLKKLAKNLGITTQVEFLGLLNREQVINEMLIANCFVLSSQVETFGVVLIEAIAMGLPVIATRCGGPEDIVTTTNGILVDLNNVPQLADAMNFIMTNMVHYNPWKLRNDCAIRFGEGTIVSQLLSDYQSILNHSSR